MRSLFKFKKVWIIILNISLIVFFSIFIWQSEKIQEKISPQRFWQNKIKTLNFELKKDDLKIKNLELNLEKELALSTYHEKGAKIKAQEDDQNPADVYFTMQHDHIKKIIDIKKEIDVLKIDENKIKHDLENAKTKATSAE
ncbi:MAG: hypothetical protein KR126chlam6_00326 [Candidatus Anoxychlamydiales bacterium]|nr:hypothetical protein [Candidatus Anoxychlamydiales bacterium]